MEVLIDFGARNRNRLKNDYTIVILYMYNTKYIINNNDV